MEWVKTDNPSAALSGFFFDPTVGSYGYVVPADCQGSRESPDLMTTQPSSVASKPSIETELVDAERIAC